MLVRIYKCVRCSLHGKEALMKNHSRVCPFIYCECSKCTNLRQYRSSLNRKRRVERETEELSSNVANTDPQPGTPASNGQSEHPTPYRPGTTFGLISNNGGIHNEQLKSMLFFHNLMTVCSILNSNRSDANAPNK